MAKVKYDVSDVEPGTDFDTPVPKGLYTFVIADLTEGESKSSGRPMLTVEYEIAKGDWKGRKLWDYIVLEESSAWKLRQFTDALGKRARGTLDTEAAVGERVLGRVKHETDTRDPDNPQVRARVGSVAPIDEEAPDEAEEEEAEESEEDLTYEDLQEYDREELESLVEDEELEVKFNAKTKDAVLLERVAEALDLEEEEEEEEEAEEEEDEGEEENYNDWTLKEIKTELKSRGLPVRGTKKVLVKRLEEDDENGEEPF